MPHLLSSTPYTNCQPLVYLSATIRLTASAAARSSFGVLWLYTFSVTDGDE